MPRDSDLVFMSLGDVGVAQLLSTYRASGSTASNTPPVDSPEDTTRDVEEDQLIADFGPTGRMHEFVPTAASSVVRGNLTISGLHHDADTRHLDPQMMLDRRVVDEHGLGRRVVYLPHEIAAHFQSRHQDTSMAIDRLARLLEAALSRSGSETLLIAKAVTDAYLVNARRYRRDLRRVEGYFDDSWDEYLISALRCTWQHAVEYGTGEADEAYSASDLQIVASWFQAWWAADDTSGGGEPTIEIFKLQRMLPGDWVWVLDHLEIAGAPEGLHLDEEVELEMFEEKKLGLPRESWELDELRSALNNVSDVEWFEESRGMLNVRVLGPQRPTTFRRVFAQVPGAIYSCLKDDSGVSTLPPTFRMYTTGDIFEALGEEVMVRSRRVAEGGRQIASLVEVQMTWINGHTHVLGWLDVINV